MALPNPVGLLKNLYFPGMQGEASDSDLQAALIRSGLTTLADPRGNVAGGILAGQELGQQNMARRGLRDLMGGGLGDDPMSQFSALQKLLPEVLGRGDHESARWITQALAYLSPIVRELMSGGSETDPNKHGTWEVVPGPDGKPVNRFITPGMGDVPAYEKPEATKPDMSNADWRSVASGLRQEFRTAIPSSVWAGAETITGAASSAAEALRGNTAAQAAFSRLIAKSHNSGALSDQDVADFRKRAGLKGSADQIRNYIESESLSPAQLKMLAQIVRAGFDAKKRMYDRVVEDFRQEAQDIPEQFRPTFRNPYSYAERVPDVEPVTAPPMRGREGTPADMQGIVGPQLPVPVPPRRPGETPEQYLQRVMGGAR